MTVIGIVLCYSHQTCCLLYYLGEINNTQLCFRMWLWFRIWKKMLSDRRNWRKKGTDRQICISLFTPLIKASATCPIRCAFLFRPCRRTYLGGVFRRQRIDKKLCVDHVFISKSFFCHMLFSFSNISFQKVTWILLPLIKLKQKCLARRLCQRAQRAIFWAIYSRAFFHCLD